MEQHRKLIFVDWAGDPGFRFRRGSSRYLIVASVCLDERALRSRLNQLRQERGLVRHYEFHHNVSARKIKTAFWDAVRSVPFLACVVVVDKPLLVAPFRRMGGTELVAYFVAQAVVGGRRENVEKATVIVDAARDSKALIRAVRVAISRELAGRGVDYFVRRVIGRPSDEEAGLQLADMIAGALLDERMRGRALPVGVAVKMEVKDMPAK
jgi:hypothetical protein